MKSTFSIAFLILTIVGFSQNRPAGIVEPKLGLHELKIGANILRTGRTLLGSETKQHEGELSLGWNRWNYVFDFGTAKNERSGGYNYENKGSYFRAGIDRNFIKNVSTGNELSLGLRYARASFEDQLVYTTEDVGFGTQDINLTNSDLTARWFELNFSLRGKITAQLYTGFTLRWKFSRRISGEGMLQTFDIPGFGNTKRQNATSIDYYLMWRIPLKK